MMKKMILGFAVAMTMIASVATFAHTSSDHNELNCPEHDTHVSVTGTGSCRHAGCQCMGYNSAGTGGKCTCGHWDYVHN